MTVIVAALSDENEVVMGADSAGISENELEIRRDPKIFIKNGFLFGFCGSYRVCQLVRYHLTFPKFEGEDAMQYMVTKFVVSLRSMLKEFEVDVKSDEDFSFIVGFKKNIFVVSADLQVAEQRDGFCAIGAGAQIAKGGLYVAKKAGCFSAKNAVVMALKAAERYCTEARGPFIIESV
jgi:ATP-dependent protease HslVU (ClpYQ) peptidase subunit